MAYEPHLPAWGTAQIETIRPATGTIILSEITIMHDEKKTLLCF